MRALVCVRACVCARAAAITETAELSLVSVCVCVCVCVCVRKRLFSKTLAIKENTARDSSKYFGRRKFLL